MPAMYDAERTYPNLLGPLGSERRIWAECLFVDPVADIAVLGQPDGQELFEQAGAYDGLIEDVEPLPMGELPATQEGTALEARVPDEIGARLLSLDGRWFSC